MTSLPNFRKWTGAQTSLLKEMWWDGESCATIADKLGGMTARAVEEKASREGFTRNPTLIRTKAGIATLRRRPDEPEPLLLDGQPVTLENCHDLDCRWPVGHPTAMQICGHRIVKGRYCDAHAARAFQPGSGG